METRINLSDMDRLIITTALEVFIVDYKELERVAHARGFTLAGAFFERTREQAEQLLAKLGVDVESIYLVDRKEKD